MEYLTSTSEGDEIPPASIASVVRVFLELDWKKLSSVRFFDIFDVANEGGR